MPPLTRRVKTPTTTATAKAETTTTTARVVQSDPARFFTRLVNSLSSGLLEFDERAVKVLGVQEKHGFSVGSDLRFARAQHPGPRIHKPVAGSRNIVHLVADMMHAAVRVLLQELGDGRVLTQGFQEFDLSVGQRNEH